MNIGFVGLHDWLPDDAKVGDMKRAVVLHDRGEKKYEFVHTIN